MKVVETRHTPRMTHQQSRTRPKVAPWIMRLFGTKAPLGYEAGDTNLYRYVHNRPTDLTDPSGLQDEPPGWQALQQRLAGFRPDLNFNNIPADRVLALVRDGLAQQVAGNLPGEGYVYIADATGPGRGYEMILQPRRVIGRGLGRPSSDQPGLPGEIAVHIDQNDPSFGSATNRISRNGLVGRDIYWVVSYREVDTNVTAQNRTPRAQVAVDNYLSEQRAHVQATFGGLAEFGSNLVPLVSGIKHAMNGEWGEAAISFAADGAMLLSLGASRVVSAGRALRAIRIGNIGVQGAVAGIRAGQAGFAFYDGRSSQAWGYLGETTLRLLGMTPGVIAEIRALRAIRSAENNPVLTRQLRDQLAAQMERPIVSNAELNELISDMYRPGATVGSGSTAAAVRHEILTGAAVGGRQHSQKARDYIVALQRWLRNNATARPGDRAAAENVIRDLQNALEGR